MGLGHHLPINGTRLAVPGLYARSQLTSYRGQEFEKFLRDERLPCFSDTYRGPNRTSIADLKGQSFLKDAKGQLRYLWVTGCEGSLDAVESTSFEGARMVKEAATSPMLKRLNGYGKRSTKKLFREIATSG